MPELVITKASARDAGKVFEFINKLADYEKLTEKVTSTVGDIQEALAGRDPLINALFVTYSGVEIGFCTYYFAYTTFSGKSKLFVEDIFVDPDCRRIGAGKTIFLELAKIAQENHCVRIELQVLDWNDSAVEFYESLGAEFVHNWLPYAIEKKSFLKFL